LRCAAIAQPDPFRRADLVYRLVRDHRSRSKRGDVDVWIRELVAMLEEQPLVPLTPRPSVNFHQRPLAKHFLAEHAEGQLAGSHRFDRIVAGLDELPRAVVPDDDVAAAVVAGRDHSLE
jgi:hypothetical protein